MLPQLSVFLAISQTPKKSRRKKYPHLKIEVIKQIEHRHPRAITQITEIKTDNGVLRTTTSMDSEIDTVAINKQFDPKIERIITPPFSLKRYKGQKKILVSDKTGKWLGSLEKHDLKNLFFEIGAMLRRLKNEQR